MEEENINQNSILMNYVDINELITLAILIFIVILSHYKIFLAILSPLFIFLTIFVSRMIKFKNKCNGDNIPYYKLLNRSLLLLCIYLYSEYTVKCIPILDLIFNKIFQFPITGKILRCFFSFLLLHLSNKIINKFNESDDPNDFTIKNDACKFKETKLNFTLIILACIIVNTYLESYKHYISTKMLLI